MPPSSPSAFTIGAMGADGRNFYNDAFTRLGYGDEIAEVERLWRDGRRDEAKAAVPIDLGRLTNLIGDDATVISRIERYRETGITTLLAKLEGPTEQRLSTLRRLTDLTR